LHYTDQNTVLKETVERKQRSHYSSVMVEVIHFPLSVNDLTELMELRGNAACDEIKKRFGGSEELCEMLYVSSTDGK